MTSAPPGFSLDAATFLTGPLDVQSVTPELPCAPSTGSVVIKGGLRLTPPLSAGTSVGEFSNPSTISDFCGQAALGQNESLLALDAATGIVTTTSMLSSSLGSTQLRLAMTFHVTSTGP